MLLLPYFLICPATCDHMCNILVSCTVSPVRHDPGDGMFSWLDYAAAAHKALQNDFEEKPPSETYYNFGVIMWAILEVTFRTPFYRQLTELQCTHCCTQALLRVFHPKYPKPYYPLKMHRRSSPPKKSEPQQTDAGFPHTYCPYCSKPIQVTFSCANQRDGLSNSSGSCLGHGQSQPVKIKEKANTLNPELKQEQSYIQEHKYFRAGFYLQCGLSMRFCFLFVSLNTQFLPCKSASICSAFPP